MSDTGPQDQPDEAMVDLLIKQVVEGLSPAEQRELDVMDGAAASAYARDFERAAAAITVAALGAVDELPAPLQARLEQSAREFFASTAPPAGTVLELRPAPAAPRAAQPSATAPSAAGPSAKRGTSLGWWAAAACLVLAVFGWLRAPAPSGPATPRTAVELPPPAPVVPPPAPASAPTPAEQRAAMLAQPQTLKVTLGATHDPAAAGVSGDVVWDAATQQGYLHFVGLKPNDPSRHTYQVWIFDGERDQRYPVDAGLFNVPPNSSEVLVPFHASLPVHLAKAFAVTVEKPGGVVVSGREHVVALGQVS